MKGKILVTLEVPLIEQSLDLYIPTVKKVGTIKNLIIKIVEDISDGTFVDDGCKHLYFKVSGELIDDQQFIKYSNIKNGSKLVLY